MRPRPWALVVAVAAGAALGAPASTAAQAVRQDAVTGQAADCAVPDPCPPELTSTTLYTSLAADAHSGPAGQNPGGTVSVTERDAGIIAITEAQVSCLSVTGHVAVIGVAGTRRFPRFGFEEWAVGLVRVRDGGGTASGLDTFELALNTPPFPPVIPPPPPPPPPTDCSGFPTGQMVLRNELGDLAVTDAPSAPSSKTDCRDGGWAAFGYPNQGQCIAFVARGPKGPPAVEPG